MSMRFVTCIFPTSFSKNTVVDDIYIPLKTQPPMSEIQFNLSVIATPDCITGQHKIQQSLVGLNGRAIGIEETVAGW